MYAHRSGADFGSEDAWIGVVKDDLFFKRKSSPPPREAAGASAEVESAPILRVSTEDLRVLERMTLRGDDDCSTHVLFADHGALGMLALSSSSASNTSNSSSGPVAGTGETFCVKTFNTSANPMPCVSETPLKLARKCVEVHGAGAFEEGAAAAPDAAPQEGRQLRFDCVDEDEAGTVQVGKEFGLMLTCHGKTFFTGKASSLGQKQYLAPGQWAELSVTRGPRLVQCCVGHDGQHALLVSEEGGVYFAGTARRGEDADPGGKRARHQPKPSKPKKIAKLEGTPVVQVAANSGSSAMVSRQGDLYIFGKDSAHTDYSTGVVSDLKGTPVAEVALGKAHVVALARSGDVYTFGMNNKGQGRTGGVGEWLNGPFLCVCFMGYLN